MCISRTTTSKTAATFKPSAHLWRFRTTREFDNKNKASRESLREPRHDQNVFGNAPRDSRKHQSISRETCGTPANAKVFPARLAGVPANAKAFPARLAGVPANAKAFPVVLAPVVQAFPKALWPLQHSVQAILQGLGASFFRSSSRCKDFWKGRSAVEGIRFAPIDRWEAIRSYDLYPKCRSDPATHFRPQ